MSKILNQFRRSWYDDGRDDKDFSEQEAKLKVSTNNLNEATNELLRAAERLNNAALNACVTIIPIH